MTVITTFSYTLGANLEGLFFDSDDDVNGTGNALDNEIFGRSARTGWMAAPAMTFLGG